MDEMKKLILELKATVEELAPDIQWQRDHDKRHALYERIQKLT